MHEYVADGGTPSYCRRSLNVYRDATYESPLRYNLLDKPGCTPHEKKTGRDSKGERASIRMAHWTATRIIEASRRRKVGRPQRHPAGRHRRCLRGDRRLLPADLGSDFLQSAGSQLMTAIVAMENACLVAHEIYWYFSMNLCLRAFRMLFFWILFVYMCVRSVMGNLGYRMILTYFG